MSNWRQALPCLLHHWLRLRGYDSDPWVVEGNPTRCYRCKQLVDYEDARTCLNNKCPVSAIPF